MYSKLQTILCVAALTCATASNAQVPSMIGYQGRVSANGTNFDGTGLFKFALVNGGTQNSGVRATATATVVSGFVVGYTIVNGGSGYTTAPAVSVTDPTGSGATAIATVSGGVVTAITPQSAGSGYSASPTVTIAAPPTSFSFVTYWSNDGTSSGGDEPGSSVSVLVSQGLFNVLLGDTGLVNMVSIPATVFTNSDVRLRIWFNDSVHGFSQLSPDQRIASVGYAHMAANVPDGSVNSAKLANAAVTTANLAPNAVQSGVVASGAIGTAQLADGAVTTAKIASGAVGSSQLASSAVTGSKIEANTIDITKLSFTPLTAETDPKVAVTISNAIPRWNGSALVNGTLFDNGNIGIGNTNPVAKLDISGAFAISGTNVINALGQWVGSPTGLQGPQGIQGVAGPVGPTGPAGTNGLQGIQGPAGPAGTNGLQGIQGVAGPTGAQGPIGLTWLGTWSSSTGYTTNDAVQYSGTAWVALQRNTNSTPVAGATWSLLASKGDTGPLGPQGPIGTPGAAGPQGPRGLTWLDTWSSSTGYTTNDAVQYNGSAWVALQRNTNSTPAAGTTWSMLASKGDVGPQGIQGVAGSAGASGTNGAAGPQGPAGTNGNTVWNGSGAPSSGLGTNGDFYIDTVAKAIYGPKTSGNWGGAVALIGPQGIAGASGPQGPKGLNWRSTWNSGTSYTTNDAVQYNGSAWAALQANAGVAPAAGTTWSLLAQKGDTGAQGIQGIQGPAGPTPVNTVAACSNTIGSSTSCSTVCGSQAHVYSEVYVSNGSCTATSQTGPCSANGYTSNNQHGTCCVCIQ